MSGLVALSGPGASAEAVERMLRAAPHRGSDLKVLPVGAGWVGIQSREEDDPFISAAVYVEEHVAVVLTGCLYDGASIVVGDRAAQRIRAVYAGGPAGLDRLPGSFAAVVVDLRKGLTCAIRSAIGERPLFWRADRAHVGFASEEKQLLEAPFAVPPIDIGTVLDVVAWCPRDLTRTAYRGIRRVVPGSIVEIGEDSRTRRFFDPHSIAATSPVSVRDAVVRFRELLHVAVRRRLRPGAAVLLSGGLDSSSIVAEAAPMHARDFGTPLTVVSATYPDVPSADESPYVKATVERFGCDVLWLTPRPDPLADLEWRSWLLDRPDIAPLFWNHHAILRGAREGGRTSLLDGLDGDAAFGSGAGLGHALLRRGRLGTFWRNASFVRKRQGLGPAATLRRLVVPPFLDFAPAVRRAWRAVRGGANFAAPSWATGPLRERLSARDPVGGWAANQARLVETSMLLALEQLDRMECAAGVTTGHPLADIDLLEFLLRLPPEVKFAGGMSKSLVRRAYPELPAEVRSRRTKTDFNEVLRLGAPAARLLQQLDDGPRSLPGVDWSRLRELLAGGELPAGELHPLLFVLSADRFLSLPRTDPLLMSG